MAEIWCSIPIGLTMFRCTSIISTRCLTGYESIRPLSAQEAAALAPMTALCHAEFALSEADYFLGVLHSEEQARAAYDGWLVGHARWFHLRRLATAGCAAALGQCALESRCRKPRS